MFERLGSWTYRFRFLIVLGWIVAGGALAALAPGLAGSGSTDQTTFLPPDAPSVVARDAIERAFPGSTSSSSASITMDRPSGLTDADRAWRDAFAAWAVSDAAPAELRAAATGTATADSRPELAELFRAPDGTFELFVVNLDVTDAGDAAAVVVGQLRDHLEATAPGGLETHVTGAAAISSDYLEAVKVGTDSTTTVTVILVIVVLLAIYRAPLAALIPLVTIGAAYLVSTGILGFLAAAGWQVSSILATFLVVMVFGVGTDYAIFLISRYREEVAGGGDWHDAARVTVRRIGAVITASAGTVIVGMLAMGVGDFRMIATMGPGIAIAVAVTLAAGLTLAPALLSIFGHYLFWPLHTRERHEGEPRGFFASLASGVSGRPGLVTVVLTAGLLVPSLYLPQVKANFDVLSDLPASADSRIGYEQIADHLGEDKLVQSTALVDAGGGADMLAPAQLAKLHALMVELHERGGMATTTSLVTPDGDTTVPDGFRPSRTLRTMADGFAGDDAATTPGDSASLLDPGVEDGLDRALDYVGGAGAAFPDVAAGTPMREAKAGLAHALDVVERVRRQSVLSTQLRTLAQSVADPANAASSGDGAGGSGLMRDYLRELGSAYPEVRALDAYGDGVRAADRLARAGSVGAALDLADAFDRLADHFDARPDATLSPESLSGTASAKALRREATEAFDALPGRLRALAAVFDGRTDDLWIPATLAGSDGADVRQAIDAFVSPDHTATRFYLTSASDPYSGGAFAIIKQARAVLADAAPAFGPGASGHIGGAIAQFTDVQDTLARDFQKVGAITVVGILVVLVLLLRAMVAPLYLVATVLVSYGSTIGISAFLFQQVLGQPGTSPYLPLMVFVLLVALGSDYNIFLMHRVREESETRPIRDGVRVASGHTGAVITSAGLILAGTFGSMASAPLTILFQVGIAVAVGVLIDTFLVRSILVPAITAIVGDRAWWPSAPRHLRVAPGAVTAPAPLVPAPLAPSRRRRGVAVGLAVLVPVLVAGLLTWSFGAASGNLGAVRAAVVNLDEGGSVPAQGGGTSLLSLGTGLVTALTTGRDDGFTWSATDEAAAASGLASGTYAAVLTIPADFSRAVAAIRTDATGTAAKATLRVATADAAGSTVGAVARAVTAAIATATAQDITASYVDDVLVRVTSAYDALARAADDAGSVADDGIALAHDAKGTGTVAGEVSTGLRQLADGADSAATGTERLAAGTRRLADGAGSLADGATSLASGARDAASGARELDRGAASLSDGLATLRGQTQALPAQVAALADGAAGVATGAAGTATGAASLAGGLERMRRDTTGMGDGAERLDAGAAAVAAGTVTARAGADDAAAGASELASGAATLDAGVGAYTHAVDALAASCAALGGGAAVCAQLDALAGQGTDLRDGAARVAGGAADLATGTAALADGLDLVVTGAAGVRSGTRDLAASLPALETGIRDAAGGAAGLAEGASTLASGAAGMSEGTARLGAGMHGLAGGIASLAAGGAALSDGATGLAGGIRRLADGTAALASGARQTASGARSLADGTATAAGGIDRLTGAVRSAADGAALVDEQVRRLADGGSALADRANGLASGLSDTAGSVTPYDELARTRVADLAAHPVAIDAGASTGIVRAERALAPYFMALATWLGVLATFLVLPLVGPSAPAGAVADEPRRWALAVGRSFALAAAVACGGAILMAAVVAPALGGAVDMPLVAAFTLLGALAFTAVVHALVALFGSRGWLASLLLLVLGIAASGIGMDAAAVPGPLALIRPLLPLTPAVDGLRAAVDGSGGTASLDAVALLAWLLAGAVVAMAAAAGSGRRTPDGEAPLAA